MTDAKGAVPNATARRGAHLSTGLVALLRDSAIGGIDSVAVMEQYMDANDRGMLLVGSRRNVFAINEAARFMLRFSGTTPEPVGNVVHDVNFGFAVGEALHDRCPVAHEVYIPDPDRLLRFRIVPILDGTGIPLMTLISVDDVTRIRHLETVRRDFVANVSHELRTPIASINLLVETLQRGALDDPEHAQHFLHRIEVETQSMARLVEELLELSRLESGALSLRIEPTDVYQLLERVVSRLAPMAEEKSLAVSLDLQTGLPPVAVDPDRIEQVLLNLVHNAIKFTPTCGQVTLRARRQGPGVYIEVIDTGVGMDPPEAARVFERFYKVDRGRSRVGGSGLGLAIARHLLQLHGSQLQLVSEVGRGSRFSFALPIVSSQGDWAAT